MERRLERMVEPFAAQPHCPIPQAANDRNDMHAAYPARVEGDVPAARELTAGENA